MITLYFIRMWLRWFGVFLVAELAEWVLLGRSGAFAIVGVVTLVLFLVFTRLLVGEWRSARHSGMYWYGVMRDNNRNR